MATFDYDALGRRIYAYDAIAGTGRYFCYNNNWQVLQEYDGAGAFAWANVFGNYIDEVLLRAGNYDCYYYAHNHLYSPVAVLDMVYGNGTVLERYDYDAYGTTHIMDAGYTARTASAVGNPYTFTGRELDTLDGGNLKTMHYRHRSYDPFVGRFEQQDTRGIVPGQYNRSNDIRPLFQYIDDSLLYQYVIGNPLLYQDPYGEGLWDWIIGSIDDLFKLIKLKCFGSKANEMHEEIDETRPIEPNPDDYVGGKNSPQYDDAMLRYLYDLHKWMNEQRLKIGKECLPEAGKACYGL